MLGTLMEWNILVNDPDPWVMYRVFVSGLVYIYVQDVWKVLSATYVCSSMAFILSFAVPWSPVHNMFTYPVAVLVGIFLAAAVKPKPSKFPALHILAVLPWLAAGFYGTMGYPAFLIPYVITFLIAKMYRWALLAGVTMVLNGILIHSPLVSLCLPIVTLLVYSCFFDIYHNTPYNLDI